MTAAAALAFVGAGCGGHAQTAKTTLVAIGAGLSGPAGLSASVYATGLPHVAAFAFDGGGRLWVTTAGLNSHRGDGVYVVARADARPVKVVGGLDDPLGLVWVGNRLLVSSLGRVTAYSGFAANHFRTATTLLHGPVAGGENNNLVRAPDRRLLLGVSASCDHCRPISPYSGAIVSFRADGSGLRVYARRIRAPFGLAFKPGTTELFASMNERDDLGARTPGDWLALVRAGESWGFPGCYGQAGSACRGVPAPAAVLDKHAASGGVAFVGDRLGGRYADSVLVSEWRTAKVLRVALTPNGRSYRGAVSTFVTGFQNPLPVLAAGSGAVLVRDWGSGKIYRIVAK